jgi:hypothetical protein
LTSVTASRRDGPGARRAESIVAQVRGDGDDVLPCSAPPAALVSSSMELQIPTWPPVLLRPAAVLFTRRPQLPTPPHVCPRRSFSRPRRRPPCSAPPAAHAAPPRSACLHAGAGGLPALPLASGIGQGDLLLGMAGERAWEAEQRHRTQRRSGGRDGIGWASAARFSDTVIKFLWLRLCPMFFLPGVKSESK